MTWLDINPEEVENGRSLFWKFSNEKDPEYRTQVTGTVFGFQRTPQTEFQTHRVLHYPDGNVKWQYRIIVIESDGCFTVIDFKPKSILHKALWNISPVAQDGSRTLNNLIGQTIDIWTEPGVYNATHPRPFGAKLNTQAGPFEATGTLPDRYRGESDMTPLEMEKNASNPPVIGGSPDYYAPPQAQSQPQQQSQYAPQPQQYQQQPMPQQMPQQPPQQQVYDDLPF